MRINVPFTTKGAKSTKGEVSRSFYRSSLCSAVLRRLRGYSGFQRACLKLASLSACGLARYIDLAIPSPSFSAMNPATTLAMMFSMA